MQCWIDSRALDIDCVMERRTLRIGKEKYCYNWHLSLTQGHTWFAIATYFPNPRWFGRHCSDLLFFCINTALVKNSCLHYEPITAMHKELTARWFMAAEIFFYRLVRRSFGSKEFLNCSISNLFLRILIMYNVDNCNCSCYENALYYGSS